MFVDREIKFNEDPLRWFSDDLGSTTREVIIDQFEYFGVTPKSHPVACDLCSGEGAVAKILVDLGWKPSNITCIDRFKPTDPLVTGVNWKYIFLPTLSPYTQEPTQEDILEMEVLKGKFDLVTCFFGLDPKATLEVANLFLKPGKTSRQRSAIGLTGIVFTDNSN